MNHPVSGPHELHCQDVPLEFKSGQWARPSSLFVRNSIPYEYLHSMLANSFLARQNLMFLKVPLPLQTRSCPRPIQDLPLFVLALQTRILVKPIIKKGPVKLPLFLGQIRSTDKNFEPMQLGPVGGHELEKAHRRITWDCESHCFDAFTPQPHLSHFHLSNSFPRNSSWKLESSFSPLPHICNFLGFYSTSSHGPSE